MLLCLRHCGRAQTSSYSELQAAYIFNFAKYVTWPEQQESFVIGIYGDTENTDLFRETLAGKRVHGKLIEMKPLASIEEINDVNIIYLPESGSKYLDEVIQAVKGKSVLIVTEEDMIKKGAMISFVVEDDKLRFKLKKAALDKVDLVASEGLLKLAIQL
jgi:hypothetical protein